MTLQEFEKKVVLVMTNLKRIRKKKGITQKELSSIAGVSVGTIRHYEQGVKDVNKAQGSILYKISLALECDILDIMELDEMPKEKYRCYLEFWKEEEYFMCEAHNAYEAGVIFLEFLHMRGNEFRLFYDEIVVEKVRD